MVTQKRRRRQLAHAAAERQAVRRAARTQKRQRIQRVATIVVVVVALVALAVWIATHRRQDNTPQPAAVDYPVASATTYDFGVTP